ncbi:MAG: hypothetical protein JWM95_4105 [Gemmatimonadetes bacterium]|nr:hypothetical protein [Gemmatimonadota bacterium]
MRLLQRCTLAITIVAVAGCTDITGTPLDLNYVAGTYVLESVTGRYAPVVGSMVLTGDGQAQRRVRYSPPVADPAREYITLGRFSLPTANVIDFSLDEDCGEQICVWNIRASREGERFTIRYPDPADGPDIVEVYHRR